MQRKRLNIILDTNILVSFLISKQFKKFDRLLFSSQIQLVFSQELFEELFEVIHRPKFKRYFMPDDINILFRLLGHFASIIPVVSDVHICRDSKDNFLLALALDSQADFLVTGDLDLLSLKHIGRTEIITINQLVYKAGLKQEE